MMSGPSKGTAGYLARNTACLISCSAFLNSLFTTQACKQNHKSGFAQTCPPHGFPYWTQRAAVQETHSEKKSRKTDINRIHLGGLPEDVDYYFNRQPWSNFLHSLYTPPVCLEGAGKRHWSSNSIPLGLDYC